MTFTSASRWLSKRHIEQFTFVNASNGFLKDDLPLWTLKIAHAVNIQLLKHTDLPRQLFWIDIPWNTYSNESSKPCEQIAYVHVFMKVPIKHPKQISAPKIEIVISNFTIGHAGTRKKHKRNGDQL